MIKTNADTVYYVIRSVTSLANSVMFTTYSIYFVTMLGLNAFELTIVGTVLETSVFLFEVPTGVVADCHGRRLSIIFGTAIMGAAYLISGSVPYLANLAGPTRTAGLILLLVLLGEAVRGFGYTFTSGATNAWFADEVGKENVGPIFLRASQYSRVAGLCGIGLGTILAGVELNLPYLAGSVLTIALAGFLMLAMKEHGFRPRPRSVKVGPLADFRETFQEGINEIRGSVLLMSIVGAIALMAAGQEGFVRLWPAHFLNNYGAGEIMGLTPVQWFAAVRVASMAVTAVISGIMAKRLPADNRRLQATTLASMTLLRVGAMAVFGFAGAFAASVGSLIVAGVAASLSEPLIDTWVNRNIDGRARATVLSMMGQTDALGQMVGGPALGLLGVRSLRAALVVSGALLAPCAALFRRLAPEIAKKVEKGNDQAAC